MNPTNHEMAALAADVHATMAVLPGPQAMTLHLMECLQADCPICRGCAVLLTQPKPVN